MERFELVVPTLFGLEALTAKEIRNLGYDTTSVTDGRVTFLGDFEAVCRANIWLRTGERVLIKLAEFKALSFDELFDGTKKVDWAHWIPKNAAFPVTGFSVKSKLFSVPDCQSIIKKAIVDKLSREYGIRRFEETGTTYRIEFSIMKDTVTLMLDTSGEGLHKRGYRKKSNAAPLRETLAASIAILSRFRYDGALADPFCGSGTLPIEAAMIAKNIAPGLKRKFRAMDYRQIPRGMWKDAKEEARELIKEDTKIQIFASDIDDFAVNLTAENAEKADVSELITVKQADVFDFTSEFSGGTIICNPPYGERLLELRECESIYRKMGKMYKKLDKWSLYALTPAENFEDLFGIKASKKRKLYNGMIKCNLYQYF